MKVKDCAINIRVKGASKATKAVKRLTKATRRLSLAMDEFNIIKKEFKDLEQVEIITEDGKMEEK